MPKLPFYYGWVVVGVSFITLVVATSIWYSFAVFFVALLGEFEWSRASTAGAFSLGTLVGGLGSPVVGMLLDRAGPRRLLPAGALILALGLLASSQIESLWQLYLYYGVFAALGMVAVGWMPHLIIVNRWFIRRRGMATGIVLTGSGLGLLTVPVVQLLVSQLGWRAAYGVLAAIVLGVLLPLTALFHRRGPEEVGALPDGEGALPSEPAQRPGAQERLVVDQKWASHTWTVPQAMRTRRFWFLFLGLLCAAFTNQLALVHHVAAVVDAGYEKLWAASAVGLAGLTSTGGKIGWGWLSDRIGREVTYSLGVAVMIGGLLSLMLARVIPNPWLVYAYALLFGLGFGVVVLQSPIIADIFYGKNFGAIYGSLYVANAIGQSLGPWLGGFLFDITGRYTLAFGVAIASIVTSCLGFWLAAPRQVRLVPGKAASRP